MINDLRTTCYDLILSTKYWAISITEFWVTCAWIWLHKQLTLIGQCWRVEYRRWHVIQCIRSFFHKGCHTLSRPGKRYGFVWADAPVRYSWTYRWWDLFNVWHLFKHTAVVKNLTWSSNWKWNMVKAPVATEDMYIFIRYEDLYSAPSRRLLRSAPDPVQLKRSFEMCIERIRVDHGNK